MAAARRSADAVALRAGSAGWPLGISVGVARSTTDGTDLDQPMRHADVELYRAKHRRASAPAADAA
jgi:GGDEF domain-containing protein